MLAQLIIFLLLGVALIAFADEIGNFLKSIKSPLFNKRWFKHTIALVGLTVLVISFYRFFTHIMNMLMFMAMFFSGKLRYFIDAIVGQSNLSNYISVMFGIVATASIPWLVLSGIYWLFSRKKFFPYCAQAIWITWLLLIAVLAA